MIQYGKTVRSFKNCARNRSKAAAVLVVMTACVVVAVPERIITLTEIIWLKSLGVTGEIDDTAKKEAVLKLCFGQLLFFWHKPFQKWESNNAE